MICEDCRREVEPGRVRCPCGALVGTVARRPHSIPDIPPRRGNADVTSYRQFLADPFPEPSRAWAHDILARAASGESLLRCQIEAAQYAIRTEHTVPVRERQPGEDFEEDAF